MQIHVTKNVITDIGKDRPLYASIYYKQLRNKENFLQRTAITNL